MSQRKALSKKVRFEVFKRDSFACQYCGKRAPEVVLNVDHIHPVSMGGGNDILNLVTSCEECNSGKSDRSLDDSTVIGKRMTQASVLQARREQIEMIAEWQRGLVDIESLSIKEASDYYHQLVPGWYLSESGMSSLRPYLGKYGLTEIMACVRKCAAQHVRLGADGRATEESSNIVCRVLFNSLKYKEQNERDPVGAELRYIAGIARNRFNWVPVNHRRFIEEAHTQRGIDPRTLRQLVLECRNWSQLEVAIDEELTK